MDRARTLTFYLNDSMRARAEAGKTNIINRIISSFELRGFQCLFRADSDAELLSSAGNPGYSIFHMEDPFHPRALNLRRAYYYPFWGIEASAKRWNWTVAKAVFDPAKVDPSKASRFIDYWRTSLFGVADKSRQSENYIFAPLQGRLQIKRSFQTMSPLEMLQATLTADQTRQVYVSLHPRENYSEQDLGALAVLIERNPRLKMAQGKGNDLLPTCDYVVTQNSAVALDGYFHHKPAVLFAKCDFHHIAANVHAAGCDRAFEHILDQEPEFDAYLYWFLQLQSINAGRADAEEKILSVVQGHGWKV